MKGVNTDYEEPEFTAQALFSTYLDDHVDRSEGYLRVILRKRSHVHLNVTAQVRDLPRMGIPLPNSDYKTYTYNEI